MTVCAEVCDGNTCDIEQSNSSYYLNNFPRKVIVIIPDELEWSFITRKALNLG